MSLNDPNTLSFKEKFKENESSGTGVDINVKSK